MAEASLAGTRGEYHRSGESVSRPREDERWPVQIDEKNDSLIRVVGKR